MAEQPNDESLVVRPFCSEVLGLHWSTPSLDIRKNVRKYGKSEYISHFNQKMKSGKGPLEGVPPRTSSSSKEVVKTFW